MKGTKSEKKKTALVTTPERSELMSRVRQSGTAAELTVQEIIKDLGVEYQANLKNLPGSPDIVNTEKKWAIFIHGCFWHAHKGCPKWTIPKRNRAFWETKFADNRRRDRKKKKALKDLGYSVLVVWSCELADIPKVDRKIHNFISRIESTEEGQP